MTSEDSWPVLTNIDSENKNILLEYFKNILDQSILAIDKGYDDKKTKANEVNKLVGTIQAILIKNELTKLENTVTDMEVTLRRILMIKYIAYVNYLQYRNLFWKYDYMSLSRRIGEMWEPFCKTCFDFPLEYIKKYDPLNFKDVKNNLHSKIVTKIKNSMENNSIAESIIEDINIIWGMVESGEINMELDYHLEKNNVKYHIDFKSGFGSNEKGNTNRLLLVGNIYKKIIEGENQCILLVRQTEKNNSYYNKLTKSGVWNGYLGKDAYDKIKDLTGFNIGKWILNNVKFSLDLSEATMKCFRDLEIERYLEW